MSAWHISGNNYGIIYNLVSLISSLVPGNGERQKLGLGVGGSTKRAT